MHKSLFSSNKTDWETPQDLYNVLDAEFHFTLDPCANAENAKCEKYYTEADNGLAQDWGGETIFCNPPYGKKEEPWVKKCYEESKKGNTVAVLLIAARTDTIRWHDWIFGKASEIRFIKGRLKFGGCKDAAPFPSAVVVFKPRLEEWYCAN